MNLPAITRRIDRICEELRRANDEAEDERRMREYRREQEQTAFLRKHGHYPLDLPKRVEQP